MVWKCLENSSPDVRRRRSADIVVVVVEKWDGSAVRTRRSERLWSAVPTSVPGRARDERDAGMKRARPLNTMMLREEGRRGWERKERTARGRMWRRVNIKMDARWSGMDGEVGGSGRGGAERRRKARRAWLWLGARLGCFEVVSFRLMPCRGPREIFS